MTMFDLITSITAILAALVGLVGAFLGYGSWRERKGGKLERKAMQDDMAEAYNDATKQVQDETSNLPDDPDSILVELRKRGNRGRGGSDT